MNELVPVFSPGDNINPYYYIDRNSRVFSTYSGIELSQVEKENGYMAVSLNTTDGRRIQRKVHRLCMMSFNYFPGCEIYQVNHKDGNKKNNYIGNFEWNLPKENVRHAINLGLRPAWSNEGNPMSKVTNEQVMEIVNMVLSGYTDEQILERFPNANMSIISDIANGNTWKELVPQELVLQMKEIRHPTIIPLEFKHALCKFYQDYPISNLFKNNFKGSKRYYVRIAMCSVGIPINESTYRMAKRLYYKYQDPDITSLYNY